MYPNSFVKEKEIDVIEVNRQTGDQSLGRIGKSKTERVIEFKQTHEYMF